MENSVNESVSFQSSVSFLRSQEPRMNFKGTVIQIETAVIDDHLRVSKVS